MWAMRPYLPPDGAGRNQTERRLSASKRSEKTVLGLLVSERGRYTFPPSQPVGAINVSYDPRKRRAVPR
jgi:hypothetical protein